MKMDHEKIIRSRKPQKCPSCGHSPVASILYGMPIFSPELRQDMDKGLVTLGGCCITNLDPAWECTACGAKIYQKGKND